MDHLARESEGEGDAGEERKDQKRYRPDGAVVENQRQTDGGERERAGEREIADQRFLRLDQPLDLAAVTDLDAWMEALGIELFHLEVDGAEDPLIVLEAHRRAWRREQHHQRVATFAREVPVGVAVEARVGCLDPGHRLVETDRRRGLPVVGEVDEQWIRPGNLRAERVARGDQILEIGIERSVAVEELLLRVDAPVHLRHQRRRQLLQACSQRVDEPFAGLQIVGAHDDREVREAADAPLQLGEGHRRRSALRQELTKIGAQIAVEPRCARDGGDEREDPEEHD